ncbi:MAG TPA: primosomal protein N' [Prolixibacteraceae bacterium]|nr:primosomal protein N' [Prolixibacteraceae bacterium]
MIDEVLFADVILPLPIDYRFTYRVPASFQVRIKTGVRVIVQFGKRKFFSALVYKLHQNRPVGDFEIKDIDAILDEEPIISEKQLVLWEWIANYYCCTLGEVYKAALPSGLKLESQTKISLNPEAITGDGFNDKETAVILLLESRKTASIQDLNRFLGQLSSFAILKMLLEKNAVIVEEQLRESYIPKLVSTVRLSPEYQSEEKLSAMLDLLARKAKKQEQLLKIFLAETIYGDLGQTEISKKDLLELADVSDAALKGLEEKQVLEVFQKEIGRISRPQSDELTIKELSEPQQKAYDEILAQFQTQQTVLLNGVTSSGKTEIYIRLIEEQLKLGKQVLYLVPEIGLTTQIITRLKTAFGDLAGIYHSKFNDAERVEIWFNVLNEKSGKTGQQYKVILGARSAIFLPFRDLGLIIVDEEHENSYKQFDPAPRYNARDMAIVMGNIHGAKVLLGSATPSYETFFNAKAGKYGLVNLSERFQDIEMPELIPANTQEAYKRKQMRSIFTPELYDEIKSALSNKEQVILFQNRRGFAPFVQCGKCGWIPKCKYCDVSKTYHKNRAALICHYCGHTTSLAIKCDECGSDEIKTRGFGTEKIEDEIQLLFPEARVARMDLDTTRAKKAYDQLIWQFETGKIDILVGTQMVTKGLDFDHVRVVGVLNADNLLNYPDFRSYERSYQLIMQVSGRAGRKHNRGKVIVQTSQPNHPVIQDVIANDYYRLFSRQMAERKMFRYPPYYRLIKIVVKHQNRDRLDLAASHIATALCAIFNKNVLGPEYPVVGRIQMWFQKEILIKLPRDGKIQEAKSKIMEIISRAKSQPNNSRLIVYANVDPM